MKKNGFTLIEALLLVGVLTMGAVSYNIVAKKGAVMSGITTVSVDETAEFDAKITKYVEGGMVGCLSCEAGNDQIKVGNTTIADDGSQLAIEHECLNCGVEWAISYAAFGISANGTNTDPLGPLN
jgi:uncharacterized Zn-binding protein involved in type VI secretion